MNSEQRAKWMAEVRTRVEKLGDGPSLLQLHEVRVDLLTALKEIENLEGHLRVGQAISRARAAEAANERLEEERLKAKQESKRLKRALSCAKQALEGLAQPCTRQDYTVAKLDEVTMGLANEARSQRFCADDQWHGNLSSGASYC